MVGREDYNVHNDIAHDYKQNSWRPAFLAVPSHIDQFDWHKPKKMQMFREGLQVRRGNTITKCYESMGEEINYFFLQ